jgi:hypothetical protein
MLTQARKERGDPGAEWIPKVPGRFRQKFEEDGRHAGFPLFEFTDVFLLGR